jgi:hypothetical protein
MADVFCMRPISEVVLIAALRLGSGQPAEDTKSICKSSNSPKVQAFGYVEFSF